jgi:hypothetical protein
VRFFIVGTKVDQIPGSWADALKQLERIEGDMRSVVTSCCGSSALQKTYFSFVTAMGTHPHYASLRKELKRCLKLSCKSIFHDDPQLLKTLRFPDEYRLFQKDIKKLHTLRPGLPILELESVRGDEYGRLVGAHANAQSLQALSVLHDVGEIIFCHVSDGKGGSKACLCWQPQVIADVIAKFADPDARLPITRGCVSRGNLEAILIQYLQESEQSSTLKLNEECNILFEFLFALRVFTPVERLVAPDAACSALYDDSALFMVPSSLQGRPSFWREVFDSQLLFFSCIRGVRYFCMDSMINVAAFVRAMTHLCSDPTCMWGCAFSFPLSNGGFIFVRLAESRDFVDVVVLGSNLSQLVGEAVESSFREISTLLRCSTSNTLVLCPHCCASDMFARSGAVHAFHRQQLALLANNDQQEQSQHADVNLQPPALCKDSDRLAFDGSFAGASSAHLDRRIKPVISCSRYHEVSESSVLMGMNVGSVGGAGMPASFPEGSIADRDAFEWVSVSGTGLAEMATGKPEVMPNSFFSLTRQLDEGDMISAQSLAAIDGALESGAKHCRVSRCGSATSGAWCNLDVCLEYCVGDFIGGREIDVILSCSGTIEVSSFLAASGAVTTNQRHNLNRGDDVLLSVPVDGDGSNVEGVRCLVTDVITDNQLILKRKHPGSAAPLPLASNVSIMPVCASFTPLHNVLVVYKRPADTTRAPFDVFPGSSNRLRILRLASSDCSRSALAAACWRDVEDNWAIMLGNEFRNYEITGITLFRCEERERLFLDEVNYLKRISSHRSLPDFSCKIDKSESERAQRTALQQQIMGHFSDFSQKFSLLPNAESKDVNLCVAWWGKWPSVYYGAAQNGFWNLPSHLKIDPGYFGEGFYLTRYPRYSDYYINGFSLSKRKVDHGSILMCYAALGRPYPVTQDPYHPPLYTKGFPSDSSPCGKACGAACGFCSSGGIDSHDCHYVTVKMHPGSGQYFPCPVRQQPDFDEIVLFKRNRIMASASIDFHRR